MNEFCDFPEGNLPSFTEVITTFSKSRTLLSRTPIICKPVNGSPSNETSAKSITCLYISYKASMEFILPS